jgi:hypothetical protein
MSLVAAAIFMLISAGSVGAAVRTRSCGYTSPGYPVRVRASANVTCHQARHVMEVVFASHGYSGDPCYHGYRFHACTVQGFRCTEHGGAEFGNARCTKRRGSLITGD